MTSVIGTPIARAPRAIRTKSSSQLGTPKLHTGEIGYMMNNASEVISYIETFLDQNNLSPAAILTLCSNLKVFGSQLEASHKEQLDRAFVYLRNIGRNDKLDKVSRLHILETIELRAGRWTPHDHANSYYQTKLNELEEYPEGNNSSATSGQFAVQAPSSPLDAPQLLPGEVVKFSGKYPQLTKIPGKNFFKDEVVIRNSDSGKVNPGANERLVQITGGAEDNIEKAKQLIEQTILRNASPVRSESSSMQTTHENNDIDSEQGETKNSFVDPSLDEYQYTVTIDDQNIKITGQNFKLVQKAKLILDEYLGDSSVRRRSVSSCSSTDDGVVVNGPQDSPPSDNCFRVKYNRQVLMHWSTSPLCQSPPPDFDKVVDQLPEIIRNIPVTDLIEG